MRQIKMTASWIALRNGTYNRPSISEWKAHLTPENAAAWPAGYRLGRCIITSRKWNAVYIYDLHYELLAAAYAAVDPECLGERPDRDTYIAALPAGMRRIVRSHLWRYGKSQDRFHNWSYSMLFCGARVRVGAVPSFLMLGSETTIADYNDNLLHLQMEHGAALGDIFNPIRDLRRCVFCRLANAVLCDNHVGYADILAAGKKRLVELCSNPPVNR